MKPVNVLSLWHGAYFPFAEKIVLAGDHWQLPPTVLSFEAASLGFNRSILEIAIRDTNNIFLLNTQYRMREVIAGFSSNYFYNNLLISPAHLQNTGTISLLSIQPVQV